MVNLLPTDMLSTILIFVGVRDLSVNAILTCKKWNALLNTHKTIWFYIYLKDFGYSKIYNPNYNWRRLATERYFADRFLKSNPPSVLFWSRSGWTASVPGSEKAQKIIDKHAGIMAPLMNDLSNAMSHLYSC
eukprot:TRINITY_DN6291_c0_g3_i1.p1 TRINITY_DN6291_c0_g3~~TRINITY_DN6291_c0_g3_i1.p1  ORF type:complete len:132 (+),score=5.91 TRINITY_DN6291_c0_g3_i1:304-699(+)